MQLDPFLVIGHIEKDGNLKYLGAFSNIASLKGFIPKWKPIHSFILMPSFPPRPLGRINKVQKNFCSISMPGGMMSTTKK